MAQNKEESSQKDKMNIFKVYDYSPDCLFTTTSELNEAIDNIEKYNTRQLITTKKIIVSCSHITKVRFDEIIFKVENEIELHLCKYCSDKLAKSTFENLKLWGNFK